MAKRTKKHDKEAVINDLVAIVGSKAELARRLDVLPQDINNWRIRGVPVARCDRIERTLGYPKHRMRPDAFAPPGVAAG